MGIFNIEPGLAVWTWITFGLLFLLLSKFVYPTLFRNIKEREEAIEKAVDNALDIEKRLEAIDLEHKQIIAVARREADRILMKTRQEAEGLRRELSEKAESDASSILEEARARTLEDRKLAVESIKKEIVDLVCGSSEKIIGHSFVAENDRVWARELVDQL